MVQIVGLTLHMKNLDNLLVLTTRLKKILIDSGDKYGMIPSLKVILKKRLITQKDSYDYESINQILNIFSEDNDIEHNIIEIMSNIAMKNFQSFKLQDVNRLMELMRLNNFYIYENDDKLIEYLQNTNFEDEFILTFKNLAPLLKRGVYYEKEFPILINKLLHIMKQLSPSVIKENMAIIVEILATINHQMNDKDLIERVINTLASHSSDIDCSSYPMLCNIGIILRKAQELKINIPESLKRLIEENLLNILNNYDILSPDRQSNIMIYYNTFLTNLNEAHASQQELNIKDKFEQLIKKKETLILIKFAGLGEFMDFILSLKEKNLASQKILQTLWSLNQDLFQIICTPQEIIACFSKIVEIPFLQDSLFKFSFAFLKAHSNLADLSISKIQPIIHEIRRISSKFRRFTYPDSIKLIINMYGDRCIDNFAEKIQQKEEVFRNSFAKKPIKREKNKGSSFDTQENEVIRYTIKEFSVGDLTPLIKIFEDIYYLNLGNRDFYGVIGALCDEKFDLIQNEDLPELAFYLTSTNYANSSFLEKLQNKILESDIISTPIQALQYAWSFCIRNNSNEVLWNILTKHLNELNIKDISLEMKKCLYQIILSRNIELNSFKLNITKFEGFFDDLDEQGINDSFYLDQGFKNKIDKMLKQECFMIEPAKKVGMYVCDYFAKPDHVVLVLGYGCYVSDTHKEQGFVSLMKRLLKKMNFKVHVIDKISYEKQKKVDEKMVYVRTAMKGIAQDEEALDKQKVEIDY